MKTDTKSFTKTLMRIIVCLYFVGAILGIGLTIFAALLDKSLEQTVDSSMFIALAGYLGGPTAISIGFYAWKSKAENILKISQSSQSEEERMNTVNALSTMGGQE